MSRVFLRKDCDAFGRRFISRRKPDADIDVGGTCKAYRAAAALKPAKKLKIRPWRERRAS
jgi:hypothetical protein